MERLAFRLQNPKVIRALAIFMACGAAIYLAAILWAGWQETLKVWERLGAGVLLGGVVVASLAYLLRFARWHYSLTWLGARVPRWRNLQVYLGGLALTVSPGKLGETLRSVLLLQDKVRPVSSIAAFVADRMSDVLGVCLLGMLAGLIAGRQELHLVLAFPFVYGASFLLRFAVNHLAPGFLQRARASRLPLLSLGPEALHVWARLWGGGRVAAFSLAALAAYGLQALVFAWFCQRAGMEIGVAQAVAVFAMATLFGAASMVPGGLGTMEAALVLQLGLLGVDGTQSVPVAIAIRLVTLWFGIFVGVMALALASRRRKDQGSEICHE